MTKLLDNILVLKKEYNVENEKSAMSGTIIGTNFGYLLGYPEVTSCSS